MDYQIKYMSGLYTEIVWELSGLDRETFLYNPGWKQCLSRVYLGCILAIIHAKSDLENILRLSGRTGYLCYIIQATQQGLSRQVNLMWLIEDTLKKNFSVLNLVLN
jgi:hypothetical protein